MDEPYADAAFRALRPYVIQSNCYPTPWEIVPNDGQGPACVRTNNGRILMLGPGTVCDRSYLIRLIGAEVVEGVSNDMLTSMIACAIVGEGTDPDFPDLLPWVVECEDDAEGINGRYRITVPRHQAVIAEGLSYQNAHRLLEDAARVYEHILPRLREPF